MLVICLEQTDAGFCLACEEYLLKTRSEDIFMLWQSQSTVVVGKHQNALAEINYRYLREQEIQLARRISGGGTVFHDAGNINFTYIKNVSGPGEISFRRFVEPIVAALGEWGVYAEISGRNDLLVNGFKISGNAEHVFKNRVLHHGTLLYNAHLENLSEAIKVIPGKYHGKAVASNRSKVANIASFLTDPPPIGAFRDHLINFHLKRTGEQNIYHLTSDEVSAITQLTADKFHTVAWQLGYSPSYSFTNRFEENGQRMEIFLEVAKGTIVSSKLTGDLYPPGVMNYLRENSVGIFHSYEAVEALFREAGIKFSTDIIYAWF